MKKFFDIKIEKSEFRSSYDQELYTLYTFDKRKFPLFALGDTKNILFS